jgi:hypothetical protein
MIQEFAAWSNQSTHNTHKHREQVYFIYKTQYQAGRMFISLPINLVFSVMSSFKWTHSYEKPCWRVSGWCFCELQLQMGLCSNKLNRASQEGRTVGFDEENSCQLEWIPSVQWSNCSDVCSTQHLTITLLCRQSPLVSGILVIFRNLGLFKRTFSKEHVSKRHLPPSLTFEDSYWLGTPRVQLVSMTERRQKNPNNRTPNAVQTAVLQPSPSIPRYVQNA